MPKSFLYKGQPKNFGRWGWIVPGARLVMTDKEAVGIKGNKDFGPDKDPDADDKGLPETDRANSNEALIIQELREKKRAELFEIAERLRTEGHKLDFNDGTPNAILIQLIYDANKPKEEEKEE